MFAGARCQTAAGNVPPASGICRRCLGPCCPHRGASSSPGEPAMCPPAKEQNLGENPPIQQDEGLQSPLRSATRLRRVPRGWGRGGAAAGTGMLPAGGYPPCAHGPGGPRPVWGDSHPRGTLISSLQTSPGCSGSIGSPLWSPSRRNPRTAPHIPAPLWGSVCPSCRPVPIAWLKSQLLHPAPARGDVLS